jgi:RNA polymerase sigma-70 factor (ECF subfamily)
MQAETEVIASWTADSFFARFFSAAYTCLSIETGAPSSDVEDLAQETLVGAWRGRAKFRGEAALLSWVLAIARNKARDYLRRMARTTRAIAVVGELARLKTVALSASDLEGDEERRAVRRALAALPEELSALLVRRYFQGQALRAIADELDEPEKTIEARLHRARERLKQELTNGGYHAE